MLFETADDLLKFFNNIDLEKSTLVLRESDKDKKNVKTVDKENVCACQHKNTDESDISESVVVEFASTALVESFSIPIELPVTVHEGENTINVTDYDFLHENFCSSGKLIIENRTILMQMCDVNGVKKVNLSLTVGASKLTNEEFIVVKSDSPSILLNKKHINR